MARKKGIGFIIQIYHIKKPTVFVMCKLNSVDHRGDHLIYYLSFYEITGVSLCFNFFCKNHRAIKYLLCL